MTFAAPGFHGYMHACGDGAAFDKRRESSSVDDMDDDYCV
jgi:hypothetical protein